MNFRSRQVWWRLLYYQTKLIALKVSVGTFCPTPPPPPPKAE